MAPLDFKKGVEHVRGLLSDGIVFIGEVDDEAAGTLGAEWRTYWYSSAVHLADSWFYVSPDYRKTSVAPRLLKAYKDCALQNKVKAYIGVWSPHGVAAKNKFVGRQFEMVGGLFVSGIG